MEKKVTLCLGLFLMLAMCSLNGSGYTIIKDSNEEKIDVSQADHPPVLSDGIVWPTKITTNSRFIYFKVHYEDEDGDPPFSGPSSNFVLVKKTDPGTPYTGIYNMFVKDPDSSSTDMYILFYILENEYRVGNYSVRFHVKYNDTTIPRLYVIYPPLDQDPLSFEVVDCIDISQSINLVLLKQLGMISTYSNSYI